MNILWQSIRVVKWRGGRALRAKLTTRIAYPIKAVKSCLQAVRDKWNDHGWLWVAECVKAIIVEVISQVLKKTFGL